MHETKNPWIVVDTETLIDNRCAVLFRGGTEASCVEWIGVHPDQEKVLRGAFQIDGPSEEGE